MFKVDGNPTQFLTNIDNDGITIVLEHHLCIFGCLYVSNQMVMRLNNIMRYYFQKRCHMQDLIKIWGKKIQ